MPETEAQSGWDNDPTSFETFRIEALEVGVTEAEIALAKLMVSVFGRTVFRHTCPDPVTGEAHQHVWLVVPPASEEEE